MKYLKLILPPVVGLLFGAVGGVVVGLAIDCTPLFRANPNNPGGWEALILYGGIGALVGWIGGCVFGFRSRAKS